MPLNRRILLKATAATGALAAMQPHALFAQQPAGGAQGDDRVFLCNEDSCTLSVIDPRSNTVQATVNLTSFDEDPRPPFRFATGGVAPTHAAMIHKPLYHGAIAIHGAAPSPDNTLIATTGRGSSNVYLIDTRSLDLAPVGWFLRTLRGSGRQEGSSAEQIQAGSAVHLTLEDIGA